MTQEISKELQAYHLSRLEALIDQWELELPEDADGALGALQHIASSGAGAERRGRMQGNLAEMRETLSDWAKKPSVILPTMAIGLAGLYQLTDAQMSVSDLEFMRDTGAIAQAEFQERFQDATATLSRAKEVTMGVLGLGTLTAASLYADKIKAFLTGEPDLAERANLGAQPNEQRLSARLTDVERDKLQSVMGLFYQMANAGSEEAHEATGKKLLNAIRVTEEGVARGVFPADEILNRLEGIEARIRQINDYTDASPGRSHQKNAAPSL